MKRKEFYLVFIFTAFSSCLQSPEMTTGIVNGKEKPTVVTGQLAPFTDSDGNLVFQGEITSKGKSNIVEKGFYWSADSDDPDIKVVVPDTGSGTFTYDLQRASGGKTYYWRAYAENSFGCDSGEVRSCQTPAIWTAEQVLNTDSRWKGAVFLLNNSIYMTCGVFSGDVFISTTWEYYIASNLWMQIDSLTFPGGNRIYPVAFTIGNLAFVGTGLLTTQVGYNDLYQFNADSRRWTKIATPNDFEARYQATAFSLNGNGYVVGGYPFNTNELNDVWQYNPNENSWEKKNNSPVNFSGGIGISGNNRAFVGFGDAADSNRTLWEYISTTDSWNKFAQLPDKATRIFSGAIVQNNIYVVDGNNNIWALNMSDTTWTQKSSLPSDILIEGYQNLLTSDNSNSIYVGLGYNILLYEYRPLWDN